jgi:hypothetical protein
MNTYEEKLIETARDFHASNQLEVANIARIRAERSENAPGVAAGNNYVRVFSHFDNGKPVFVWQNWGGV